MDDVPQLTAADHARLLRRGFQLEYATLGWNVVGVVILAVAAVAARSVALAGFGVDSLIEIGASAVVIWELSDTYGRRRATALRLIATAFILLVSKHNDDAPEPTSERAPRFARHGSHKLRLARAGAGTRAIAR